MSNFDMLGGKKSSHVLEFDTNTQEDITIGNVESVSKIKKLA